MDYTNDDAVLEDPLIDDAVVVDDGEIEAEEADSDTVYGIGPDGEIEAE